jgi:DNA-binding NtrC family response regulator
MAPAAPAGSPAPDPRAAPAGSPVSPPVRVLLAEDEAHLGAILEQYLATRGAAVTRVRDGRAALEALATHSFDVALLDVVMPEVDGLEVLRQARRALLPPEIIVITGNSAVETTVAAMGLGAYDVLAKPYRLAVVEALVRRAWEKRVLTRVAAGLRAQLAPAADAATAVTGYAPLRAALALAMRAAVERQPVLIEGPRGAGKAHVARLLHLRDGRPEAPFLEVACAGATAEALELALFGREREAVMDRTTDRTTERTTEGLTGRTAEQAPEQRPVEGAVGALEAAAGGTVLLRDVEALALPLQRRLDAALADGGFLRPGGRRRIPLDARVVAATTGDVAALVAAQRLDAGLARRLQAVRLRLPPLAERAGDVALLARHFAAHRAGGPPVAVSDGAIAELERHPWPGNVAELRRVIEAAARRAGGSVIDADDLELGAGSPVAGVPTLAELERRHIADVLARTRWHQGRAAALLGISPKTLYRKIREYGFRRPAVRPADR